MQKYIMALDQGTTSSRCILFDKAGNVCSMSQKEFTQIYPKPGWVEHNPMEIWSSQLAVAMESMAILGAGADEIGAIGITNQRETTVLWDKNTGEPVYNAVVWQCRRTSDMIEELKKDGFDRKIREKTGLIPDAYFSASKIAWILENVPGARARAEAGELLFGTAFRRVFCPRCALRDMSSGIRRLPCWGRKFPSQARQGISRQLCSGSAALRRAR